MNGTNMPTHVAIIMDGNGRWATKRGLNRSRGHLAGSKTMEKLVLYAKKIGIKVLSVFAFSTDNFKRSKGEVEYLKKLFIKCFNLKSNIFIKNNIKVVFSGGKDPLSDKLYNMMRSLEEQTKNNTGLVYNICLNYGGQEEIVSACRKFAQDVLDGKANVDYLDKNNFYNYLYNDLSPIDLLIRTSGEYRISNFMIYQSAYSEYYFTKTYFPDFNENELDKAISAYTKRDRRLGGIKSEKKSN